jgi:hypothetical protein
VRFIAFAVRRRRTAIPLIPVVMHLAICHFGRSDDASFSCGAISANSSRSQHFSLPGEEERCLTCSAETDRLAS